MMRRILPLIIGGRAVDARVQSADEAGVVTGGVLLQNGREIPLSRLQP